MLTRVFDIRCYGRFVSLQVPSDVDFRVMDTFLLFYNKLLGFVNFSLYSQLNLRYPPLVDESKDKEDVGLNALILEAPEAASAPAKAAGKKGAVSQSTLKAITAIGADAADDDADEDEDDEDDEGDDEGDNDEHALDGVGPGSFPAQIEGGEDAVADIASMDAAAREEDAFGKLFENMWFFCSREVPREAMEFIIRSFGGHVSWQGVGVADQYGGGPFAETDPRITHHIVDRPKLPKTHLGRHYVQPQWVVDCINCRKVLPTAPYTVGATLPPHLSPFGEEGDETDFVVPDPTAADLDDSALAEDEAVEDEDTDDEALHRQELEAEARGEPATEEQPVTKRVPRKKKVDAKAQQAAEEREMAM